MVQTRKRIILITGLSGAGKSQAARAFEDMGFFCIDNLPPTLMPSFVKLCFESGKRGMDRLVIVADIRLRNFLNSLQEGIAAVEEMGYPMELIFLEASEDILQRRFNETRRVHPLKPRGRVLDGIREEMVKLSPLREEADFVIDTSYMSAKTLNRYITEQYGEGSDHGMGVTLMSFGYKKGLPPDADIVYDVRFIKNPFYDEALRPLCGLDEPVRDYVFRDENAKKAADGLLQLLAATIPAYLREGKKTLTVAIGCTGGQHRSVAVAEYMGQKLLSDGVMVHVAHRDLK